MSDAIQKLRQRADTCRLLAQTALTDNGREALFAMAKDYDLRAQRLGLRSQGLLSEVISTA